MENSGEGGYAYNPFCPLNGQTWLFYGLNMARTWFSWLVFFVNPIYCVQGYILPNFRVLASILTDISDYLQEEGRKGERKEELVSEGT